MFGNVISHHPFFFVPRQSMTRLRPPPTPFTASLLQTDEQNVLKADLEEWQQSVKEKERALVELDALQQQVRVCAKEIE